MFMKVGWTSVDDNCNETGAHFIDINGKWVIQCMLLTAPLTELMLGDGLDDFVCVALDGTAFASVNNGDETATSPPTFKFLGKWKDREGYDQARVRLGDVDGDGRADYCVLMSNGDIRCWRNGWISESTFLMPFLRHFGQSLMQATTQMTFRPTGKDSVFALQARAWGTSVVYALKISTAMYVVHTNKINYNC